MAQPMGATVVLVDQSPMFGRLPATCVCPNCRAQVTTNVETSPGVMAWLLCAGLLFVGCWPCACLPFCMDSMQDVTHRCPACGAAIARRDAGM